jgi:hypothetical protein
MIRKRNAQGVTPERRKTRAGKTLDVTVSGPTPNVNQENCLDVPRFPSQACD